MTDYTLTEMTDIIGSVQGLSFSETRGLHRQLKGLSQHGLIRPHGSRGTADRAADFYDLHAVCMARVFAALMAAIGRSGRFGCSPVLATERRARATDTPAA